MPSLAFVGLVLARTASDPASVAGGSSLAAASAPSVSSPAQRTEGLRRRFGLHLGLNATLTFDLALGRYFYGGFTTQLTGVGYFAEQSRNYVLSALAYGGVALPLVDGAALRLTVDVTPMASYFHSAPVNMLSVGLLGGLRVVHSSGFTAALRLPLVGYAGAPDAQRGGLTYYYIGAVPTVPILTFGYTF
jgi:hypothetical protein